MMKVALIQLNAQPAKDKNLEQAYQLISAAVNAYGPDLIVLPEVFNFIGGSIEARKAAAETLRNNNVCSGQTYQFLQNLAKKFKVAIHCGSMIESDNNHFYNTSVVFDNHGLELAQYRKIHLFDVTIPGNITYKESELISPGNEIVTYQLNDITVGCTICYDLRFAELFIALIKQNAKVIIVPAAFTYATGEAHWEILLRARAIETQCYIVAVGQTGSYQDGKIEKRNWGHSMVIDPWGKVIAQMQEDIGYLCCELDFDLLTSIRTKLPINNHRCL